MCRAVLHDDLHAPRGRRHVSERVLVRLLLGFRNQGSTEGLWYRGWSQPFTEVFRGPEATGPMCQGFRVSGLPWTSVRTSMVQDIDGSGHRWFRTSIVQEYSCVCAGEMLDVKLQWYLVHKTPPPHRNLQ